MKYNHNHKQSFTPDEKEAYESIAEDLGFNNAKVLHEEMKRDSKLRKEVLGMMEALGFSGKNNSSHREGPKNHGHKTLVDDIEDEL